MAQFILYFFCFFLTSCIEDEITYAPVTEVNTIEPIPMAGKHKVCKGETLYEIAWRYGLDYRYLALRNKINPPYSIQVGQIIYLLRDHPITLAKTNEVPKKGVIALQNRFDAEIRQMERINVAKPSYSRTTWMRPAQGKIIQFFSPSHKGISIRGRQGDPIVASADGKVVYCGNGLHRYGNLIILKHNSLFFSAYAHNRTMFVKEGDTVRRGQKIAEMGHTGTDRVKLHFEIRRAGEPIDPVKLLSS